MLDSTQTLVLIVVAALVVLSLIFFISKRGSRQRHAHLKERFGPEYERAVEKHGSESAAERDLRARERRIQKQRLQPLAEADRLRFSAEWNKVQARFVDDPNGATTAADELIKSVMTARGYSDEQFDQRVADLSVEHANVVDDYRAARELAEANREGRANTEELRQAFVHYRALFADLLAQPQQSAAKLQEARA